MLALPSSGGLPTLSFPYHLHVGGGTLYTTAIGSHISPNLPFWLHLGERLTQNKPTFCSVPVELLECAHADPFVQYEVQVCFCNMLRRSPYPFPRSPITDLFYEFIHTHREHSYNHPNRREDILKSSIVPSL